MKLSLEVLHSIGTSRSERTAAFFDAVMAIAISLMVLELDVTQFKHLNFAAVKELFVPFTALIISFLLLAEVWIFHVRIYSLPYIRDQYSPWRTATELFFVCLFPKATDIMAKYSDHLWSVIIYLLTIALLLMMTVLNIRIAIGHASKYLFRATPIRQENPLRIYPLDFPDAIRALSANQELRETYSTLQEFIRLNILEFIVILVTTFAAAIMLMFVPGVCYVFLAADLALVAVLRSKLNRIEMSDFLAECDILFDRLEELYEHADGWRDSSGHVDFDAEAAQLSIEEDWTAEHAALRRARREESDAQEALRSAHERVRETRRTAHTRVRDKKK